MFQTNEELQKAVLTAIKWEPMLHAAEIGITAKDGIITLTGVVDNYAKKSEAENAAKNVIGVKGVAEEITVDFGNSYTRNDTEIANEILTAWKWNWRVPKDRVKVKVEEGWVTLDGELVWNYQKEAAKDSVVMLAGVKGVTNNITIKSEVKEIVEKSAVENAISRNWSLGDKGIQVAVSGNDVTLTGSVNSVYQKEEAGRLAWGAPGVWNVDNQLVVEYEYEFVD